MHMVNVTPIVGLPQFTGWAQVYNHTFSPGLDIVCTVSVSGAQAGVVGRVLIEAVTQHAPRSAEELYDTVHAAVTQAETQQTQVSLALIFFTKTQSTLITYNATVLLKRGEKIGKIISPRKEILQVEGKVQAQDTFIALTHDSAQFVATIEQQFEKGFDVDGVVTTVVPAVHSQEDSSTTAIAFMSVPSSTTEVQKVVSSTVEPQVPEKRVAEQALPVKPLVLPEENTGPSVQEQVQGYLNALSAASRKIGTTTRRVVVTTTQYVGNLFSGKTRVETVFTRKRVRILLISIGILLVAAGIVTAIVIKQRIDATRAREALTPFRTRLTELQKNSEENLVQAREETTALVSDLEQYKTEHAGSLTAAEVAAVASLLADAKELEQDISGKEAVAELPIFYDLRLAEPNLLTSAATVVGDTAVFVDAERQTVIFLNTTTKQVTTATHPELAGTRSVAAQEGESAVAVLSAGVYQLKLAESASTTELKAEGDSNRDATLLGTFGTYLYVFNPEKRNLYRYALQEDGSYSDPIGWLRDPLGVPFETIASFAIDGDVWFGSTTGEIKRFQSGSEAAFSITGLEQPFEHALILATTEDSNELYVLERDAARIVVLSKEGQFIRQIESYSLAAATQLLISSTQNKLYVVSGSIIYEIQL